MVEIMIIEEVWDEVEHKRNVQIRFEKQVEFAIGDWWEIVNYSSSINTYSVMMRRG